MTWGCRRRRRIRGRALPGSSRRSRWDVRALCWAPKCPGWPGRAGTGISCWSCCSLSGVLLADPDGVYDPGVYNDRLLLGLKGTMSEAELYLIRQRMLSGKLAKAERGELAIPLPIGYLRRPSGEVILDPD